MYYSLFDILKYKYSEKGLSEKALLKDLKSEGVTTDQIDMVKNNCWGALNETTMEVISNISGLGVLELRLLLRDIPEEYESSYYKHIHEIAGLLYPAIKPRHRRRIKPYWESIYGKLYHGDCLDILQIIQSDTIDLIFADPPFNLRKDYKNGRSDDMTQSDYISWSKKWIDECVRVLKPGGSFYIYNIPKWCIYYAEYLSNRLFFQNWIAIDMKNSFAIKDKYTPSHYGLLYFTKSKKPKAFHKQRLPIQTCRHCGGEIKDYGGYKYKMNPNGVNIADVWYDIYPVRKNKNRPYNELSVKLLDRIISCSSDVGDMVLDPFGGSGTTYAVAEILKRNWVGIELGNCNYIRKRMLDLREDRFQIEKIAQNKNRLFSEMAIKLRRKNSFWLVEG